MKASRRQSADPLERYDTPAWVTRALLDKYPTVMSRRIVEPCAGARAVSDVLELDGGCRVRSFDIAPRADGVSRADALSLNLWRVEYEGEAVVTNPPFSLAAAIWRLAHEHGATLVALLLRLSWLEAAEDRVDIPDPDGLIVVPRPKYIESPEARAIREAAGKKWGGDSVTSAWMIWHGGFPKLGIVRVTRARKALYERAWRLPAVAPDLLGERAV